MRADLEEIKKKALPILKEAGVLRSAIFGSYATGENREDSDIDILVDVPRGTTLFDLVDLKYRLEEALGKEVDLVTYDGIHPLLRDIMKNRSNPIKVIMS